MAIKPTVGIIDFAKRTSEAIRNRTALFDASKNKHPIRPPRHIGADAILLVRLFNLRH